MNAIYAAPALGSSYRRRVIQCSCLALVGSALALLGAFGFSRLVGAAFPNMEANSPLAMAGVALLLMAGALVACYLAARHVSRISPAETLKAQ